MFELNAGIRGGKAPVDTNPLPIAFGLLSCHLAFHFGAQADATVQTLPSEDREFNLGHVQPTVMLGSVMHFQLVDFDIILSLSDSARFTNGTPYSISWYHRQHYRRWMLQIVVNPLFCYRHLSCYA